MIYDENTISRYEMLFKYKCFFQFNITFSVAHLVTYFDSLYIYEHVYTKHHS